MKKSLLLLVVAIFTLTTAFDANAQWTDRNTFNLKGPVKTVEDPYFGFLEFQKDGTIIFDRSQNPDVYWNNVSRDEYGRITNFGRESYCYNSKGQVIETFSSGGGMSSTIKYYYNTNGLVTKAIVDECNMYEEDSYTTTYTYQKFDKYGNWIKRTAKTGRKSTVETRTITYYE